MILVLSGPVHSGKTTFLQNLLSRLKARDAPVCGYLSPAVVIEGEISGYDLFDIQKGWSIPFLRREGESGWQKVGPYFFLPPGLEAAKAAILGSKRGEWLIVDEVGPAELSGKGVWPAMSEVLLRPLLNCLLVVRKCLVSDLRRKLGDREIEIYSFGAKDLLHALLNRLSTS